MEQEVKKQGFDLTVTHRDPHTGLITHRNPYTLRIVASSDGSKQRLWERPSGSGNIWDRHGNPAGRFEKTIVEGKSVGKFVAGAKHKEFVKPLTADQLLANSLVTKDSRIAELEKELANIRADQENKVAKTNKGS